MQNNETRPIIPGNAADGVCKDCQNRQVGCHSACRAYLAFAQANRERREANLIRQEQENDIVKARFRKALRKKPDSGR